MGLDSGQISLGNIGGLDHYEYRPVGDAVNTASRIERVNKHLGTRILASGDVLSGLDRFLAREVGCFVLEGKLKPVVLYELIGRIDDSDAKSKYLCDAFAKGLLAFKKQQWGEAIRWFRQSLAVCEQDGPANFYLALCEEYKQNPPPKETWDGLICLGKE
jgi:adenylate cyclase